MKISDSEYKAIGKRIKKARLDRKMTQEYVSEQLGVGCQHISNIERGIIGISFETFYELAKLLNCGADYLMFGATPDIKNPIDMIMKKMNSQQRVYVEESIRLYAHSCGIEIE